MSTTDSEIEIARTVGARFALARSRIVASGTDRKDFLNRMATSDLAALAKGTGAPAFFLERTGRLVDRALVLERGEDALLLGTASRAGELLEWLSRYVIADDVELRDVSGEMCIVTVLGPSAPAVLAAKLAVSAEDLPRWSHRRGSGALDDVTVVRAEDVGDRSFHVLAPRAAEAIVHEALAELPSGSDETYRALRIAAGVPEFGADFDQRTIPLETSQMDHFSFTKGCYVGQEVIARLHNFKRVKRALVRLRIEDSPSPSAGAPLFDDGTEVGTVTSAADVGGIILALGYVRVGADSPGCRLSLSPDARRRVEVLPLTPSEETA